MNTRPFPVARPSLLLLAASLAMGTVLFAGCVVARERRPHREVAVVEAPMPSQDVVIIRRAPPAPRIEVIAERPSPGHVWLRGHWRYAGQTYVWEPGRWVKPPRRGVVWVEPRWESRNGGYVYIEGFWR